MLDNIILRQSTKLYTNQPRLAIIQTYVDENMEIINKFKQNFTSLNSVKDSNLPDAEYTVVIQEILDDMKNHKQQFIVNDKIHKINVGEHTERTLLLMIDTIKGKETTLTSAYEKIKNKYNLDLSNYLILVLLCGLFQNLGKCGRKNGTSSEKSTKFNLLTKRYLSGEELYHMNDNSKNINTFLKECGLTDELIKLVILVTFMRPNLLDLVSFDSANDYVYLKDKHSDEEKITISSEMYLIKVMKNLELLGLNFNPFEVQLICFFVSAAFLNAEDKMIYEKVKEKKYKKNIKSREKYLPKIIDTLKMDSNFDKQTFYHGQDLMDHRFFSLERNSTYDYSIFNVDNIESYENKSQIGLFNLKNFESAENLLQEVKKFTHGKTEIDEETILKLTRMDQDSLFTEFLRIVYNHYKEELQDVHAKFNFMFQMKQDVNQNHLQLFQLLFDNGLLDEIPVELWNKIYNISALSTFGLLWCLLLGLEKTSCNASVSNITCLETKEEEKGLEGVRYQNKAIETVLVYGLFKLNKSEHNLDGWISNILYDNKMVARNEILIVGPTGILIKK